MRLTISVMIARPRPPSTDWAAGASGYAFPSGHTTAATIAAALMAWLITQRPTFSRPNAMLVWGLAAVVAVTVGITRIYLGVHWPTDVIGGWALGVTWAIQGIIVIRRWQRHAAAGQEATKSTISPDE